MCGIVGAVASRDVMGLLVEGLRRLEYRGYDSAGMAVIDNTATLKRLRALGKVAELSKALDESPLHGFTGIAHTRWATHGKPSEQNAHPHFSQDEIAVVHNGIIENHHTLRDRLISQGYRFDSETDTEVCAHLIHFYYKEHHCLLKATQLAIEELQGAFAIGVIHQSAPKQLIAIRKGSPLVVGLGDKENFIASDPLALQGLIQNVIYLNEDETVVLTKDDVLLFDAQGQAVTPVLEPANSAQSNTDKGEYRHFMLKEIFEQPQVLADTLQGRLTEHGVFVESFGENAVELFQQVKFVHIIACGTSFHAGLVAKYWIEAYSGLPCSVEVASEYRYRTVVVPEGALFVTVSQSGETADTLAALRKAKTLNYLATLGICNVPTSTLVRESALTFLTRAGVEIGVASTKAFTTQLCGFVLLALSLAKVKTGEDHQETLKALVHMPALAEKLLALNEQIKVIAEDFADKQHALFLGRGVHYPIALEGALKLKEISYIHAEAYPAGELKHGPLALVDSNMPVIAVAPNDELLDKLKSNLEEVRARGGELYVFAETAAKLKDKTGIHIIELPSIDKRIAPIVYTIPLQLLAYHVAVLKGTDVDQPRNLAKSVTVE